MRSSLYAANEIVTELPIPPVAFGIISFTILLALLLFTWAFRSVWTRRK